MRSHGKKTLVGGQSTRQSSAVSAIFAFLLTAILATFPTLVMVGCNDEPGTSVKVTRKTPQPPADSGGNDGGTKCCDVDGDGYCDGGDDCSPQYATVEGGLKSGYNGTLDCDHNTLDDPPVCGNDPKAVDCNNGQMSVCAKCINPGALEVCDGVDNDCDGQIDEAVASLCEDGDPCTTDSCDSATGTCVHQNNTAPCDDGDPCTEGDVCEAGVCVGGGDTLDCDDGDACTDDSCDSEQGCVHDFNSSPCEDGNLCTVNDVCVVGVCLAGQDSLDCDDGNECTDDSCDPETGCTNVDNTIPCDDGDECTAEDMCSTGACMGLQALCDDANPCTDDSCDLVEGCVFTPNTEPCDDGNFCTDGDVCAEGACVGTSETCDDGLLCTEDVCDEEADSCDNLPMVCPTIGEMCFEPEAGGEAPVCAFPDCDPAHDLGGDETLGDCAPLKGEANVPEGYGYACAPGFGLCFPYEDSDGDQWPDGENDCVDGVDGDADWFTTGQIVADCDDEACSSDPACLCAPGTDCDDGNPCTTDSCDPDAGGCVHVDVGNENPCNDGNACTTNDVCIGGVCVGGPPATCDDGNLCSDDSCNPATGCTFTPLGSCPGEAGQLGVITTEGAVLEWYDLPATLLEETEATGSFDAKEADYVSVTLAESDPCFCFFGGVFRGECQPAGAQTRYCASWFPPAP